MLIVIGKIILICIVIGLMNFGSYHEYVKDDFPEWVHNILERYLIVKIMTFIFPIWFIIVIAMNVIALGLAFLMIGGPILAFIWLVEFISNCF